MIPGGKNSKKYESKKDNKILEEEEDAIKKSKTISLKGKKYPKNFEKDGGADSKPKPAKKVVKKSNNKTKGNPNKK